MNSFEFGILIVFAVTLLACAWALHKQNNHLRDLMRRERFIPLDSDGIVFEPELDGLLSSDIEFQYDYVRPSDAERGHYGTQHNIEGNENAP